MFFAVLVFTPKRKLRHHEMIHLLFKKAGTDYIDFLKLNTIGIEHWCFAQNSDLSQGLAIISLSVNRRSISESVLPVIKAVFWEINSNVGASNSVDVHSAT